MVLAGLSVSSAIQFHSSAILVKRAGPWLTVLRMSGVNHQGQAHIVSTAIQSPGSGTGVEATPWFRTWFPIDPQPASISPTINISIVFICAFLVDHGRIICHPAIKNDSRRDPEQRVRILRAIGLALWSARAAKCVAMIKPCPDCGK